MLRKLNLRGLCIILLSFFFLASCAKSSEDSSKSKKEVETLFAISVMPTIKGEIQEYLETNGEVLSKVSVDVFPDIGGKISRFTKNLGNRVSENEVIAYVDPSKPGLNYALSPVRSPISGTITKLPYKAGSTVTTQTSLAVVSRLDQLEVVTYVAERFFSKVHLGQKAIMKFEAFPGEVFYGKVVEISPFIDSSKRTLEIKIALDDPNQMKEIEMGMFAEIRLITADKDNVVKTSNSAITRRNNASYIFVVVDSNPVIEDILVEGSEVVVSLENSQKRWVEQREIIEGISIDGQVEVLEGLEAGELVVVRGQNSLGNGSTVRIVEEIAPISSSNTAENFDF